MLIRRRNDESCDDIDDNDDGNEDVDDDDNNNDDDDDNDNDNDNNKNNNNNNNDDDDDKDGDEVRQKRDWLGTGQLVFDSRRQQRPRSSPSHLRSSQPPVSATLLIDGCFLVDKLVDVRSSSHCIWCQSPEWEQIYKHAPYISVCHRS